MECSPLPEICAEPRACPVLALDPASALPCGLAGRPPRRAGARSWMPGEWRGPRLSKLPFHKYKNEKSTLCTRAGELVCLDMTITTQPATFLLSHAFVLRVPAGDRG